MTGLNMKMYYLCELCDRQFHINDGICKSVEENHIMVHCCGCDKYMCDTCSTNVTNHTCYANIKTAITSFVHQ